MNEIADEIAIERRAAAFLDWYQTRSRPVIERNAAETLGQLDSDSARLSRLLDRRKSVTVCFLGPSGIGKSTLLNALAGGARQVLPAGGIGPLTAKATEVHFSEVPSFIVTYHPRHQLNRLAFALEQKLKRAIDNDSRAKARNAQLSDISSGLDVQVQQEVMNEITLEVNSQDEPVGETPVDNYIKQAKQLTTGNQYAERTLEYLVDALRIACTYSPQWGVTIEASDQKRIEKIKEVLALAKDGTPYERQEQRPDDYEFLDDLKAHTAGSLAPLIATIQVGWPSNLLKSGVVLVDLPGIGIANDTYRHITKQYVRDKARAVVLVVDRSGPTEDAVNLLRTSGYWDRLVGATDDPESDPCRLLIAVTRVDDVANEEWLNKHRVMKKRDVFEHLVAEFKIKMRIQITEALTKIGTTDNQIIDEARMMARQRILEGLDIYPLSAPEFRKLMINDDDDRSFLRDVRDTGVPTLGESLVQLATSERNDRLRQINDVTNRLGQSIDSALKLIRGRWEDHGHASVEAERVSKALELFSAPKKKEFDLRVGGFREYLDSTVQTRIRELVLEARIAAEGEVRKYLRGLRDAHWATLRAAVRRGGTFYGRRHIDLPNDIVDRFQEPTAAVWSQRLLKDIRKRTSDLASDILRLVEEICVWANESGGTSVRPELLTDQRKRIGERVEVMRQVGKEAVDELRQAVKQKLTEAIHKPISDACKKFVADGDDVGRGVKNRILDLFEVLAKQATDAAQGPATAVLKRNFEKVRKEIQDAFETWGDPIQETKDIIVERHEQRMKRSDAQQRGRILEEVNALLQEVPATSSELVH